MFVNFSLLLYNNSRASYNQGTITTNCHRSSFIGLYCSTVVYTLGSVPSERKLQSHVWSSRYKLVMCAARGAQSCYYKNCVDTMVTVTCDQVMSSGVRSGKDTSSGPVYDDQECCLIGKVYFLRPPQISQHRKRAFFFCQETLWIMRCLARN